MSSVSPIDTSQMPLDVQKAGPAAQKLYATALSFENVLVQQLTKELDTSQNADQSSSDGSTDDGSTDDGTTAMYQQMLPGALAQGITDAGGIGLANELYRSLSPASPAGASPSASTGTSATTPPAGSSTPAPGTTK